MNISRDQLDSCLPIIFGITTLAFFVAGLASVRDVYSSLKRDFDIALAQTKAG
jgi:hypothetical protein